MSRRPRRKAVRGPTDPASLIWIEAFERVQAGLPKSPDGRPAVLVAGLTFGERDRIAAAIKRGEDREAIIESACREIRRGRGSIGELLS